MLVPSGNELGSGVTGFIGMMFSVGYGLTGLGVGLIGVGVIGVGFTAGVGVGLTGSGVIGAGVG